MAVPLLALLPGKHVYKAYLPGGILNKILDSFSNTTGLHKEDLTCLDEKSKPLSYVSYIL